MFTSTIFNKSFIYAFNDAWAFSASFSFSGKPPCSIWRANFSLTCWNFCILSFSCRSVLSLWYNALTFISSIFSMFSFRWTINSGLKWSLFAWSWIIKHNMSIFIRNPARVTRAWGRSEKDTTSNVLVWTKGNVLKSVKF